MEGGKLRGECYNCFMIVYREITPGDIPILAAFRLKMFTDMGAIRDENQAQELLDESTNYFQSVFGTQRLLALIAEVEGVPVSAGVLAISSMAPKPGNLSGLEGYIYNLYTLPAWRNKGIGSHIFKRLLAMAEHRGVKYHWLLATQDGRNIYAQQGFIPLTTAMKKSAGD
jgi:GNAT superfamily N-acetyltransferase